MKSKHGSKLEDKIPIKNDKDTKHKSPRKRGNYNRKAKKQNKTYPMKEMLKNELSTKLESSKEAPTILIELSARQWQRLQPNSVHLSDVEIISSESKSVLHKKIHYNTIEYGENIKLQQDNFKPRSFKMKDTKTVLTSTVLNYPTIKDKVMIFTTDTECINKVNSNHILITSNNTPTCLDDNFHPSGKILVYMIKLSNTKDPDKNDDWLWRDSLLPRIKKCKNSLCIKGGKYNHFNSQGYIAAFGNKALFAQSPVNSTVSQYVSRKGKNENEAFSNKNEADVFESLVSDEVEVAVDKFTKYFPNIKSMIAPILNVAFDKQVSTGDVNFKEVMTSRQGLWQSELCCNAVTKDFHTERDVTYTLISVPYQFIDNNEKNKKKPTYFLLQLNENTTVALRMLPKSSFFFSGTMITHRQFCEDGYEEEATRKKQAHFYNIACYGNERLFHHLRESFKKKINQTN